MLGDPPRPPVPVDWLPSGAARTERAFRTYMAAMGADDDDGDEEGEPTAGGLPGAPVRGMAASPGRHDGTARVVLSPSELGRVRKGDVLVVEFTTPAFNVVLPVVGAIVADRGGLLSHTAIVAREQGIPAVVAASEATTRIPDGTRVRVDGTTGEVTVLG
jgi:pyruvate,water dikinase